MMERIKYIYYLMLDIHNQTLRNKILLITTISLILWKSTFHILSEDPTVHCIVLDLDLVLVSLDNMFLKG